MYRPSSDKLSRFTEHYCYHSVYMCLDIQGFGLIIAVFRKNTTFITVLSYQWSLVNWCTHGNRSFYSRGWVKNWLCFCWIIHASFHSRSPAPRGHTAELRLSCTHWPTPLWVGLTSHSALTLPSRWSVWVDVSVRCGNFTERGVVMGNQVAIMRTRGEV